MNNPSMQPPTSPQPSAIETLPPQPNIILGAIGGFIGMLLSAAIWGAITYFTNYQISWMAIGVGFVVGFGVKWLGKGSSAIFGLLAAVLALVGCLLGNLFFYCGILAREYQMGFMEVLTQVIAAPDIMVELFKVGFQIMDVLFYGLAIYVGFQVATSKPKRVAPPQA